MAFLSRERVASAVAIGVSAAAAAYLYYRWRSASQEQLYDTASAKPRSEEQRRDGLWARNDAASGVSSIFEVTERNGFLPLQRPLRVLPQPFEALERIMSRLPELLQEESADAITGAVASLPELAVSDDASPALLQALMRDYSILVSAYLLKKRGESRVPANVARPFARVCAMLKEEKIMSYDSYCLSNCYRETPEGRDTNSDDAACDSYPMWEWEALRLIRAFDGGPEEATFILIHSEIESHTPRLVRAFDALVTAVHASTQAAVLSALQLLRGVMESIIVSQLKMFNASDPRNYERFVRPWIFGWKNNPDFPSGVVFEGVDGDAPTFLRGETGAQSTIIPSMDIVLGITHKADVLKQMLMELEAYRPAPQRAFLAQLRGIMYRRIIAADESGGGTVEAAPAPDAGMMKMAAGAAASASASAGAASTASLSTHAPLSAVDVDTSQHLLRDFVAASRDPELIRAFNACVAHVWAFRDIHVTFSEAYIARFTRREAATGGTPYKAYLRKHRDESIAQQMQCTCGAATCGHDVTFKWSIPDNDTFSAEVDAILSDDTSNGIPAHLLKRHAAIIAREGRGSASLQKKSFPAHGQMSRR